MQDFELFDIQSYDDLKNLLAFCERQKIGKIVYSPLKITKPRTGELSLQMRRLKRIYEHLAGNRRLDFRGGSWRLPYDVTQAALFAPFLQLCKETGITAKGCKENLIATH